MLCCSLVFESSTQKKGAQAVTGGASEFTPKYEYILALNTLNKLKVHIRTSSA